MFKDKDVICFLGDSITANGLWMAEAYQELRKKYKIKCYNIGVPGGRVFMAEKCLYSRCLAFNPDYVTVSFGVNDVEHTYYADKYDGLTEDELKEKAFEFEEWNRERYDKEQLLRWFNFVEYCAFIDNWADGKSTEDKKAEVLKSYEGCEDKTTGVAGAFRDYPEMLNKKERIMEDIIRLTI